MIVGVTLGNKNCLCYITRKPYNLYFVDALLIMFNIYPQIYPTHDTKIMKSWDLIARLV